MNVEIADSMHVRFKVRCIEIDRSMSEVVIHLLTSWLETGINQYIPENNRESTQVSFKTFERKFNKIAFESMKNEIYKKQEAADKK